MKPETKKAAKAREIAEKVAAKERAKEARREKVFSTPVAIAVEPLRVDAMLEAKTDTFAKIQRITDKITKILGIYSDTFDINAVAPVPNWSAVRTREDKKAYEDACDWESKVESITSRVEKGYYYGNGPKMVYFDSDKTSELIVRAEALAAMDYEAFVYKLVEQKVGDHTAAELVPMQGIWTHSILTVTKKDGTVEQWETKRIINRSVHGKLFFQWPTRNITKGE